LIDALGSGLFASEHSAVDVFGSEVTGTANDDADTRLNPLDDGPWL